MTTSWLRRQGQDDKDRAWTPVGAGGNHEDLRWTGCWSGLARQMKVGLVLPTWASSGEEPSWDALRTVAAEAENAGLDSLWVCDDVALRLAGSTVPMLGCLPVAAAVLARTSRIEVGTLVTNAHTRPTLVIAKEALTLGEIGAGRFVLGLGAGDDEQQHLTLGLPWADRVSRFEERLHLLAQLVATGHADYVGKFEHASDLSIVPWSARIRPQILVGAKGPRMMRVAASCADRWNAWLAWSSSEPATAAELIGRLASACRSTGRDPATIEKTVAVAVSLDGAPVRVGDADFTVGAITGTDAEIARQLAAFGAVGVDHLQVQLAPATPDGVGRLAGLRALAEAR